MNDTITASHAITIEDVEYQPGMLARLYRPKGTGPLGMPNCSSTRAPTTAL